MRHIYPKNAYTLRETIFEKPDGFNIPYIEDQKLFRKAAVFDFESICVPTEELKATETATWIEKHVPISVSISSNLQDDPIFLCEKDPELLIIAFVSSLQLVAEKRKLQMRTKFQKIENTVNDQVNKIFETFNDIYKILWFFLPVFPISQLFPTSWSPQFQIFLQFGEYIKTYAAENDLLKNP